MEVNRRRMTYIIRTQLSEASNSGVPTPAYVPHFTLHQRVTLQAARVAA